MTLDGGHYYIYFFVAVTYGKASLWLWEKPGKFWEFFLLLCRHPVIAFQCCCLHIEYQSPHFESLLDTL